MISRRILTAFERSTRPACDALSFALTQLLVIFTIQSLGLGPSSAIHSPRSERPKASGKMFTSEIIQLCRALARCGGLLALPRRTIVPLVSLLLAMPSAAPSDDFWKRSEERRVGKECRARGGEYRK